MTGAAWEVRTGVEEGSVLFALEEDVSASPSSLTPCDPAISQACVQASILAGAWGFGGMSLLLRGERTR